MKWDTDFTEDTEAICSEAVQGNRLVLFVALKALGVLVAIPAVVLGALLTEAWWNPRAVPGWWWSACFASLSLGVTCDAVGRIGCGWVCRHTPCLRWFVSSILCQWTAIFVWPARIIAEWFDVTVPVPLIVSWAVFAQCASALLFTLGLKELGRSQHWPELEGLAQRLLKVMSLLPPFLYTWVGAVGCFAVLSLIQVVFFLLFVPWWLAMPMYLAIGAAGGGVVVLGLLGVIELQYLRTLWRVFRDAANRDSARNATS